MSKTNIYKIGCREESGGVFTVNAADEESARAKAQQLLDDKGFDPSLDGFSVKHGLREVDSVEYVGEQTTIPFDAFTEESAKTIEDMTDEKVGQVSQATLDIAEVLDNHPLVAELRGIRDSDQFISVGGDGCAVMQVLRGDEDVTPLDLAKKLEGQESCYDKMDAIIDMVKILIAENGTLITQIASRDIYENQIDKALNENKES